MRILITNNSLATRAGTELVVWELAQALQARGHEVAAYSSELGEMAGLIREAHVSVVRDPNACPFKPDIIHGQHHLDTMSALLSFPDTPAVFHSHGGLSWVERAPLHPRILNYVAMCPGLSERIGIESGVPEHHLHTVFNWVDLNRFSTVRTLPEKPRRALVYTRMLEDGFFLDQIRAAFDRQGIELDLAPAMEKGGVRQPESLLPEYDIVLAAGRSALEAIASGCATMVVNYQSSLGFVTAEKLDQFRNHNLAPLRFAPQLTTDLVERQLAQYNVSAAVAATEKIRHTAGLDQAVDQLVTIYRQTLDEWQNAPRPSPAEETAAAAAYLRFLLPGLKTLDGNLRKIDKLTSKVEDLKRARKESARLCKDALQHAPLLKQLRGSVWGRLALHFAKRRLRSAPPQSRQDRCADKNP